MRSLLRPFAVVTCTLLVAWSLSDVALADESLVGHWKLDGNTQDASGKGNHGTPRGDNVAHGEFDGRGAHIEVAPSESLRFGTDDFTFACWINTQLPTDDTVGDILELYDPAARRGLSLSVTSSAGGYQSGGDARHLFFGVDNAKTSEWVDCGRPNPKSNYVSNSLTVFEGKLYAATAGGENPEDWGHVYTYEGNGKWRDCGRVGDRHTPGVLPMVVHEGDLYVMTCTYDWARAHSDEYEPGRLYRYAGGTEWEDLGSPANDRTFNCLASYQGRLYAGGGPRSWAIYSTAADGKWETSITFPKQGPRRCYPHTMCRFNGELFVGFPSVYRFDGSEWHYAGVPSPPENKLQTHSMVAYRGDLCAGTWPLAKVARYKGGEEWEEFGRVGEDGTEVNSLVVYNGKLYGGSLPRSEVCRYDGKEQWTSLVRFYSPEGWVPVPPGENGGNATMEDLQEWSRLTSLTVYDGKLFASTGNCTSHFADTPLGDSRGKVYAMEAGRGVSYHHDIGSGWKHVAAVREGNALKLYLDGKLVGRSREFDPAEYDLSTDQPLRIGMGPSDSFQGKMKDVRAYRRGLSAAEVATLAAENPEG